MRLPTIAILATFMITGCAQQGSTGGGGSVATGAPQSILSSLRPKADPAIVAQMRAEEQARKAREQMFQQQQQQQQQAAQDANGNSLDIGSRILPKVSTDPIAPPAEQVAEQGPIITPADGSNAQAPAFPSPAGVAAPMGAAPSQPVLASYGSSFSGVPAPPPGAIGLVPPPPAVTLSTQVGFGAGVPPAMDPGNPYMNPYMNPYAIPYPGQAPQMAMVPPVQGLSARPAGSLFGSGSGNRSEAEDQAQDEKAKKRANFVPITPTGMEPRSAYKQRDDLKALWNGVLKGPVFQPLLKDKKAVEQLGHIEVGLPGETTRGSFSISQRTSDSLFKNGSVDKHLSPYVRKVENDLSQAYYRYLYTYNKFCLAQQTLAARKQEVDVAGSQAEQQRAAADLSQAQTEIDSAREDMRSAQSELASIAGSQATRYIVGKVSGVTPSAENLAQGQETSIGQAGSSKSVGSEVLGAVGSIFSFGKGKKSHNNGEPEMAADQMKLADAGAHGSKSASHRDKKKKEKNGKQDKIQDLVPAPAKAEADDSQAPVAQASESAASKSGSASGQSQSDISFELKGVNITARKSILSVSIRNSGANNFSFSPDVISISESNHKLSSAAIRADFDQTMVQPNQEVKGTITIFGRPWNDRLAVVLSDGRKSIQMRR